MVNQWEVQQSQVVITTVKEALCLTQLICRSLLMRCWMNW